MTSLKCGFGVVFITMMSCGDWLEYSPNQTFDHDSPQNLNQVNVEKLLTRIDTDDTVTIAFIGDSQRFYDEVELFVEQVNKMPDVDFVCWQVILQILVCYRN